MNLCKYEPVVGEILMLMITLWIIFGLAVALFVPAVVGAIWHKCFEVEKE